MPQPRKRFGQHFLNDQIIIQRIVASLNLSTDDHVIEIGPGLGALTIPLLKKIKQLEAIELDRDLIAELQLRTQSIGKLIIYTQDVLKADFRQLRQDTRLLRIIGNFPYNISTPLLFHLLTYTDCIADITGMLQKEVAHRLIAEVGSAHYGRLSVMIQYYCQPTLLFDIPPTAFYPPPQVISSMVQLIPYAEDPYLVSDKLLFATIVKEAFNQRRKTLRNSLKNIVNDNIWANLNIPSTLRAENLSVKDFVNLTNAVSQQSKEC